MHPLPAMGSLARRCLLTMADPNASTYYWKPARLLYLRTSSARRSRTLTGSSGVRIKEATGPPCTPGHVRGGAGECPPSCTSAPPPSRSRELPRDVSSILPHTKPPRRILFTFSNTDPLRTTRAFGPSGGFGSGPSG